MSAPFPTQIPEFDGGVDPSGLRSYLNTLVVYINKIIQWLFEIWYPISSIADQTILGNDSGGTAAPAALTPMQVRSVIALTRVATQTAAYSVVEGVGEVPCNASGGAFRITVPFALGTTTKPYRVRVYNAVDPGLNQVGISGDGLTDYTHLISFNDAGGVGWLDVEVDGAAIQVFGLP